MDVYSWLLMRRRKWRCGNRRLGMYMWRVGLRIKKISVKLRKLFEKVFTNSFFYYRIIHVSGEKW